MDVMKSLYLLVPLFALLIAALCFAVVTWTSLGDTVPLYGWFAIGGGVLFSLLIGGGLMALMFYSARHGSCRHHWRCPDDCDQQPEHAPGYL